MPHARVLMVLAAGLLVTGCGDLLSLHALFTTQTQVFDGAIEGRWENKDNVLLVERSEDRYEAILQSKTDRANKVEYEVHLVDIGGLRFADLLPEDQIGHMIVKVQTQEGRLRMSFLDSEWLRQRTSHEEAEVERGNKRSVLTERTPQLRALVAKYARELKAYDKDDVVFERVK